MLLLASRAMHPLGALLSVPDDKHVLDIYLSQLLNIVAMEVISNATVCRWRSPFFLSEFNPSFHVMLDFIFKEMN